MNILINYWEIINRQNDLAWCNNKEIMSIAIL